MKKIILVLTILSLLTLVACGNSPNAQPGSSVNSNNNQAAESSSGSSFVGSLVDAMKLGKSFKCTITDSQGNAGDIYVKGNKFKSESTVEGTKAFSIVDENKCVWIWQEGNAQGSKICADSSQQQTKETSKTTAVPGQVNTGANVRCTAQDLSDSMFSPPTNVQFTDLAETLKGLGQPSGGNIEPVQLPYPNEPVVEENNQPASDSGY